MDNIITGAISIAVFSAFVLGLAGSISALPFVVIVVIVVAMALYDYVGSVKESLAEEKETE